LEREFVDGIDSIFANKSYKSYRDLIIYGTLDAIDGEYQMTYRIIMKVTPFV
jgi:hypothetical protein